MEHQSSLEMARKYVNDQNFEKAKEAYLQALSEDPSDKERGFIWAELSNIFYQQKAYQQVIEAVENALNYYPQYRSKEELYRLLGFTYLQLNEDQKAVENLERSLQLEHSSEKQQYALYELAKLYFKHQQYEKAGQLFREVEAFFYQNRKDYWLSTLFYKGFVFYYANELEQSEKIFEELLENAPDALRKATGLFGLAFIAFQRKQYLNAINLCEAVTSNDPNFFDMETVGFLTAASFFHLGREDVFDKYYDQLRMKYPEGRYITELKQLKTSRKN